MFQSKYYIKYLNITNKIESINFKELKRKYKIKTQKETVDQLGFSRETKEVECTYKHTEKGKKKKKIYRKKLAHMFRKAKNSQDLQSVS